MSSAASTQPRSIVVRILRRFLRQPVPKLAFERKLSLDLAALLGEESIQPRWLKPLDVSNVLARYGIDPRTTPHRIDATGAACTDSSALPQCDAILAPFTAYGKMGKCFNDPCFQRSHEASQVGRAGV